MITRWGASVDVVLKVKDRMDQQAARISEKKVSTSRRDWINDMNVKRFMSLLLAVVVLGMFILFARHGMPFRRSLPVGDMEWIDLGRNLSEIQFKGNTIVGPCQMEIWEEGDVVYGNSDENSPWFVLDKKTHRVIKGECLHDICREMGIVYPKGCFAPKTFLTRWNAVKER